MNKTILVIEDEKSIQNIIKAFLEDERNNYNMASYYDHENYAFMSMAAMTEALKNYSDGPISGHSSFPTPNSWSVSSLMCRRSVILTGTTSHSRC